MRHRLTRRAARIAILLLALPAFSLTLAADQPACAAGTCCKICKKGKACGNSCIARDKTCTKGPGCACNG